MTSALPSTPVVVNLTPSVVEVLDKDSTQRRHRGRNTLLGAAALKMGNYEFKAETLSEEKSGFRTCTEWENTAAAWCVKGNMRWKIKHKQRKWRLLHQRHTRVFSPRSVWWGSCQHKTVKSSALHTFTHQSQRIQASVRSWMAAVQSLSGHLTWSQPWITSSLVCLRCSDELTQRGQNAADEFQPLY